MSEHGQCRDCGGTDGKHFNDSILDICGFIQALLEL